MLVSSSTISSNQPTRVIKHLQDIARRSPASHGDIKDKRYLADKYFSEDPAIGDIIVATVNRESVNELLKPDQVVLKKLIAKEQLSGRPHQVLSS